MDELPEYYEYRQLQDFEIGDTINIRGHDRHVMFIGYPNIYQVKLGMLQRDDGVNKLEFITMRREEEFIARKRGYT